MGRWGLSELPAPGREVVGLMSHFARADCDAAFTERQIERFRDGDRRARAPDAAPREQRRRRSASPPPRLDAARCGIALYGISPFGTDPADGRARAGARAGT